MRKFLIFVAVLSAPASTLATVSVTFNAPTYGFNVLGGSVRTLNVGITGGTGNLVNWTVSGTTGGASATLSASTNAIPVVTVTMGATAGTCSITGVLGSYVVSSTATVTIQAQSVDDVTKTATTTIKVCTPTVSMAIVPFYRTLYTSQPAELQSYVLGASNINVTWAITAQPGGGNGTLADTANRDTVFSATVAGRYTITATSVADGTKTATATMNVTGNALPYATTPEFTTPVDCSVDAAATGTTYEVGPARAFTTIQSVPMDTMPAGSTVRIHNDDLTGLSPTTYHEYFETKSIAGTPSQPLRVVGCPDSLGNLPIVDASNATGASWVSAFAAAGFGIATVWKGSAFGYYQAGNATPANIVLEGIHYKNAKNSFTYTTPAGVSGTAWLIGASCVNVRSGYNIVVLGNDMDNCGNGTFSDANMDSNAWGGNVLWSDWEGNHIHNAGEVNSFLCHTLYVQGWGQVMQFNRIDGYTSGANGSMVKSRGIGDVIRYNYIGDGAQRVMDLVDLQDSDAYERFENYLGAPAATDCNTSFWCLGDTAGPNVIVAWQEMYHNHYAYGNVFQNSTAEYTIHFSGDSLTGMGVRLGTLYFYNNTFNMVASATDRQALFDTSGGGGTSIPIFEWQKFQVVNNIVWTDAAGHPYWNLTPTPIITFQTNLLNTNWGNINTPINGGSVNGLTGNGWSNQTDTGAYPLAVPMETHLTGLSAGNFLTTGTQPFTSLTYLPPVGSAAIGAATALTGAMAVMPVRFQMRPDTGVVTARANINDIGALAAGAAGPAGVTGISNGVTLSNGAKIQ